MAEHTLRVGCDAGKQAERLDRLEHGHAPAVECPAATRAGDPQQFSFQRKIDDFRHPHVGTEQHGGQRRARIFCHADRCCVDDPVCIGGGIGDVCRHPHPVGSEARAQPVGHRLRPRGFDIDENQILDAQRQRRMRYRRTRAAGTELHNPSQRCPRQSPPKTLGKAPPIGVVADPAAVAQDHRIDRAKRRRIVG